MSIVQIKTLSTCNAWEEAVKQIPEAKPFADKSSFGKKQGFEILKTGYEAGIRDAQLGNLRASR